MLKILESSCGSRNRARTASDRDDLAHGVGFDADRLVLAGNMGKRVIRRICADAHTGAKRIAVTDHATDQSRCETVCPPLRDVP